MKIAIIGGGACGLVLASYLEKHNFEYTIFEKSLIGRKVLASGNGKANIANVNIDSKYYHNNEFAFNFEDGHIVGVLLNNKAEIKEEILQGTSD